MATTYTTKQFETVDLVCMGHYGRTADVTEAVLDINPGLAALGPVLGAIVRRLPADRGMGSGWIKRKRPPFGEGVLEFLSKS